MSENNPPIDALKNETKDFQEVMKIELKNRFSSPFTASFIISWIVTNIKLILFVLFSKRTIEYKLKNIYLFSDSCTTWLYPLLWAILYTFIILFIIPRIKNWIKEINLEVYSKSKDLDILADSKTLINSLNNEIDKLKILNEKTAKNYENQFNIYDNQINEHEQNVSKLKIDLDILEKKNYRNESMIHDFNELIKSHDLFKSELANFFLNNKVLFEQLFDNKYNIYAHALSNLERSIDFYSLNKTIFDEMNEKGYIIISNESQMPKLTGKWELQKFINSLIQH